MPKRARYDGYSGANQYGPYGNGPVPAAAVHAAKASHAAREASKSGDHARASKAHLAAYQAHLTAASGQRGAVNKHHSREAQAHFAAHEEHARSTPSTSTKPAPDGPPRALVGGGAGADPKRAEHLRRIASGT